MANQYYTRVQRVVEYITNHLDDDLSVMVLADIACFSEYHFHRIYRVMMGETVKQTVRRFRLQRAAKDLIEEQLPILQVAERAGYSSVEAFSRAFKSSYGQAPNGYGECVRMNPVDILQSIRRDEMFSVEIKNIPPLTLVAIDHQGNYMGIGQSFEKLFLWAGQKQLLHPATQSVGIYYDDPETVERDQLRSKACLSVGEGSSYTDLDLGVHTLTMQGGCYGVLTFRGPYAELDRGYEWLYKEWLPQSGEEVRNEPPLEFYKNDPKTTPVEDLLTDICVPLRAKV